MFRGRQGSHDESSRKGKRKRDEESPEREAKRKATQHLKSLPVGQPNCLDGYRFCITGILDSLTREESKNLIEKYGGRVTSVVSGMTAFLVTGEEPNEETLKRAKAKKVKIINEDEFFELIKTKPAEKPSGHTYSKKKKAEKNESGFFEDPDFVKWDFDRVGEFLKNIRMSMYCEKFKENEVDGEVLRDLTQETAKDLVQSFHVKKLLARIQKLYDVKAEAPLKKRVKPESPPKKKKERVVIPIVDSSDESPVKSIPPVPVLPPRPRRASAPKASYGSDRRKWEFKNEHNNWIPYPGEVNEALRQNNIHTYTARNGHTYTINLMNLNQRNNTYLTVRPVRLISLSSACWEWQNEHGQWIAYPEEVNESLRLSPVYTYKAANDQTYKVDVTNLISTNTQYGTIRKVRQIQNEGGRAEQASGEDSGIQDEGEKILLKFKRPDVKRRVKVRLSLNCTFGEVLDRLRDKWGKVSVIGTFEGSMIRRTQTPAGLGMTGGETIQTQFPLG